MQQPGDEENLVCVCGKRYKRRYMYNLHTKMCGEMRKALRQEVTTQEAQEQEVHLYTVKMKMYWIDPLF